MRSPQSFSVKRDGADSARDVAALTASSLRWAGKGERVIARAVATALDAALRPALVYVALRDPASGETVTALDGALAAGELDVERWTGLLQSETFERLRIIAHPAQPGKLKLLTAPVGLAGDAGYIVVASAEPAFPTERDELLLDVASHQAALAALHAPPERAPEAAPAR